MDYDIDCVSILTYEFGSNGEFVGWSPYFNGRTEQSLKDSMEFEYPTGEQLQVTDNSYGSTEHDSNIAAQQFVNKIKNAISISIESSNKFGEEIVINPNNFKEFVKLINEMSKDGKINIPSDSLSIRSLQAALQTENVAKLSEEQTEEFLWTLKDLVDRHNLYIDDRSAESYTKNYVVYQMYQIGMNPANLVQAQVSVDQTTDEPKNIAEAKSKAGQALKNATPGNFANIYQSIEDNHVGKDVIGISAVGLKSFFALTQYVNTILRSGNWKEIEKLIQNSITFGGKEYYTIANANAQQSQYALENAEILEKLQGLSDRDAALALSALLSLATDNAKELCLSKLNANAAMAGMYIYGLSMGISMDDLTDVLIGPLGDMVASYLKGSVISDKLKLNNTGQVIKFLTDPIQKLKQLGKSAKFAATASHDTNVWARLAGSRSNPGGHWSNYLSKIKFEVGSEEYNFLQQDKVGDSFEEFLTNAIDQVKKGEASADSINNIIDKVKEANNLDPQILQYFDLVQETINSMEIIANSEQFNQKTGTYVNRWEDLKTLYLGAEEMKLFGRFVSLNQGIKNGSDDFFKFIFTIEEAMETMNTARKNCGEEVGSLEEYTFEKFAKEPEKISEMYVPVSFNIFDAITKVPHYKEYVEVAYIKHKIQMESSAKYRSLYNGIKQAKKEVGATISFDKRQSGVSQLIDDKMHNITLSKMTFMLPENNDIISIDSELNEKRFNTKCPAMIHLGTTGGNATFKHWMESKVIPNIKNGYDTSDKSRKTQLLSNNGFIKSLQPNLYNKNATRMASVSWYPGINMSPRKSQAEQLEALARLQADFDNLSKQTYKVKKEDGTYESYLLQDLFFWYNMIAYGDRPGERTLTSVFKNYRGRSKEAEKFRRDAYEFDMSGNSFDFTDEELAVATAQIENPYSSTNGFIFVRDNDTMSYRLAKRGQSEKNDNGNYIEHEAGGLYDYSYVDLSADPNLVTRNPVEGDIINHKFSDGSSFKFNTVTDDFESIIDSNYNVFTEEMLDEINIRGLYIKEDPQTGKKSPDIEMLKSLLEQKTNCE